MKIDKLLIFSLLLCSGNLYGRSILTPFTECFIEDLKPGEEYYLSELTGDYVKVNNPGDRTENLKLGFEEPAAKDEAHESIPDAKWLRPLNSSMKLKPGQWEKTDVLIKIPSGKEYYGRSFRVDLLIETTGEEDIQAAIRSRVVLETKERKGLWRRIRDAIGI